MFISKIVGKITKIIYRDGRDEENYKNKKRTGTKKRLIIGLQILSIIG
jgi:hypothetical protein